MTVYMFPGQGSQTKGMGEALFPEFLELVAMADDILGYSIVDLCLHDPQQQLNQTQYTQPALYVVNALSYLQQQNESAEPPRYVIGHSLGEYNALFAAEVFDFATGLRLVQKRGALMGKAIGGGMAAIIGLTQEQVLAVLAEQKSSDVTIANYNSHKQMVITGPKTAIEALDPPFHQAGARLYIPLKVSGAFHSRFMAPAREEFKQFIKQFPFSTPKITVVANVDAKPYSAVHVQDNLIEQITHSVLWTQSIEYLLSQGETTYMEIGPGKVLTGLVARIQKGQ